MLLATALVAGPAAAHPKQYVNVTGDVVIVPLNCEGFLPITQGGVCFPAGHVTPDPQGKATLQITDTVALPTSACYQQDNGMSCIPFCATFTLVSGINWIPERRVEVFIDGPLWGNHFVSVCGQWSQGTVGHVTHG
jgi:hypothetical protein